MTWLTMGLLVGSLVSFLLLWSLLDSSITEALVFTGLAAFATWMIGSIILLISSSFHA